VFGDVETVKVETTWSKKGLKRSEKVKRRVQKIPETGQKGPKKSKKSPGTYFSEKHTFHQIRFKTKKILPPASSTLYSPFIFKILSEKKLQ